MSDRFTKKDAIICARHLAEALDKKFGNCLIRHPDGKFEWQTDCWDLSYAPVYGGCKIVEIMEGGGQSDPFGTHRMPPRQFCEATWFARSALSIYKKIRSERIKFLP